MGRGVAHLGACRARPLRLSNCWFALWCWHVQAETGMEEEQKTLIVQKSISGRNHWSQFLLPYPFAPFWLLCDPGAGQTHTEPVGGVQCVCMR